MYLGKKMKPVYIYNVSSYEINRRIKNIIINSRRKIIAYYKF